MINYQNAINAIVEGVRCGDSTLSDIETRLQIALAGADVIRQALTILRREQGSELPLDERIDEYIRTHYVGDDLEAMLRDPEMRASTRELLAEGL